MVIPGLRSALRALLVLSTFCFTSVGPCALAQEAVVASGPAHGQVDRVIASPDPAARRAIPGHVPTWATASRDQGAIPDTQQVQLNFGLSRAPEVEAAFRQLLDDQQNPASPRFHQWLTPAQVGQQYGPTQHDIDALTTWLTSQGFAVEPILPGRTVIQASAPASVVEAALRTGLHTFSLKAGNLQAPTAEPTMPASLTPIVNYIGGLAVVPYHTHSVQLPGAMAVSADATGAQVLRPDFTASSGYHALVPGDFATIYNLNPVYNAGIKGNGQKVTIIGGSQLAGADLANYETLAALPSYVPNTIVPTGTGFSDPGFSTADQTEGMLDFERVYGTAPGSTVDFLISKNWLNGTVTQQLLLYAINTLNNPILSISFGACEALQTPAYVQLEDTTFAQAASQGISVFVSSGDSGAEGCDGLDSSGASTQYLNISDYCASGSVTCVGGTEFADTASPSTYWSGTNGAGGTSALSYIPEGGWNDPVNSAGTAYRAASSGGGVSTIIAKPSWQKGTGVPTDGFRDVPDISFSGSVHNGYIVCQAASGGAGCNPSNFSALAVGGTSASAPSMAGVAALINQKLGARQGNLNPLLYKLAGSSPAAFHDATPATSGVASCSLLTPSMCNNSVPTTTTGLTPALSGYALTVGYDQVTGLGSLDVSAFLTAAGLPTPTGVLTAAPTTITIAQTVKFTATFTAPSGSSGTPTGTVQFLSNGAALGSPVAVAGGSATTAALSFGPAGTYSITANYSGDTSFGPATTPALSLIVTNPSAVASTSTLTATNLTPNSIQAVGFTTVVSGAGGPATGTVQFIVDGANKGAPVALVSGSATLAPAVLSAGSHQVSARYSGDATYAASSSNTLTITVTALASTVVGSATPSTITLSQTTNVSFTVSGSGGGPTPTGSVTLFSGANNLGNVTLTNGVAAGSLGGFTAAGTYTFTGQYSGDGVYAPSQSASFTVTVTAGVVALSIAPATPTLTTTAGTPVTDLITITSSGFVGAQNLTCAVTFNGPGTAVNNPTCSFSPISVSFTGSGTQTSTITIGSLAPHNTGGGALSSNRGLGLGGLGGTALCALFLTFVPRRSRRLLKAVRVILAVFFLGAMLTTLSGCGSSYTAAPAPVPGTTPGSYTVVINANSNLGGSGNVGATNTIALTIR